MNPNRSTDGFTPLAYLNWIERGGTEDWRRLYRLCHDGAVAQTVAALLPTGDPDMLPCLSLWKFLIEDLHPQIRVSLDRPLKNRSPQVPYFVPPCDPA